MPASAIVSGSCAAMEIRANAKLRLGKVGELLVPAADAISSGPAFPWRFAPEPAFIPFRPVVKNEGKFSRKHPPFTGECQVSATHLSQRNVLPLADLVNMFIQAVAQRSFAFGGPLGSFPKINQIALKIEGIDSA